MKRILAILLAVFLLASLTACYLDDTVSLDTTAQTGKTENVTTENWSGETDSTTENTEPEPQLPAEPTEPDSPADATEPTEPDEEEEPPFEPEAPADPVDPVEPEPPETNEDPKPPHEHSYTGTVTKPASCTDKGVKTFTCSCGDSYTENISATGHNWGDWKTVTEPTASSEGVSQRQCKTCKKTESKPIEKLPAKVTVTQAQLQEIENQFLILVNLERQRVGVGGLTKNSHLDNCAQTRSQEIVVSFSHTRPNGASFSSVVDITKYPYAVVGENLAMTSHIGSGYYYPDQDRWVGSAAQIEQAAAWIFTALKNSPGHYANMINGDYQHCGIGISYTIDADLDIPYFYVAHIFGGQA